MNRFLANERTQAGMLLVAAALIGGTGCVTAMVVSNAERKKWEEKEQLENAATRAGAERGEVEAMTRLGWYQVSGNRFGVPADPRGVTLLEQAAARRYVPAEYLLGLVLAEGRKGIAPDPARGLELLKLSATKNCTVSTWQGYPVSHRPALTLGVLYHQGTAGVPADDSEAELWMARNAAHCGYSHNEFFPVEGLSKEQYQAQQQAWSQLAGRTYVPGSTPPSSQQLQETERELQRLRKLVRDSEAKYPAPPRPKP